MATRLGNRSCVDPAALARDCQDQGLPLDWWGRANLFRNPLGRGPGAGAVLLTKADLDALDTTTDHSLVFEDDRRPNAPITLRRITLLRAQCVTPGHRDDARAVYLCEVVDRRHFLALVPVDAAYNVRNADGDDYLSETLNGSAAFTWQEVVDDLTDTLSLDPLTLPFTPDGTPENLRYHAGWAWAALNDVLDRIACAVKLDHATDTLSVVRLGDSATAAAVALSTALGQADRDGMRVWDKYHVEPNRGRLPEKVRVLFPRRPVPTDGSSPWFAEDVTLTATTGVEAGTFVQLRDDLTAIGAGTPTNAAALTTRATERAADWRRKRIWYEKRVTLVYRDFRADLAPGETAERAALDDHGGPMTTVLEAGPDGAMEQFEPWAPPVGADMTAAAANACRSMLVGIGPDTCLTGSVSGVGKCAMIAAASVGMVYYPATDTLPARWVSDPFTTAGGETTATVYTDTAGDPRATLTVAGETGPLTYLGCDGQGRLRFAGFDCLWCSGTWAAGPCGENKLYLAVACGCDPVSLCSCDVPRVFALAYRLEPSVGASADFVDLATAVTATYVLRYFPTGTYIEYGTHYYVVTSAAGEWFGAFQIGEGTAYAGWLLFRFILDSGTCIWSIAADFFADDGGTSNPLSYETYLCTAGVDEWDCSPFSGSTGCDVNHSGGSPSNLADAFFDWGPDVEYDDCAQDSGSGTGSGGGGPDPDPPAVGCCTGAGEALEAFPDLDLTIPDGPYAGTVTFTYSGSGGGVPSWDGPGGARVECSYGGTLVLQASTAAGSGVAWATAVACDPFGAVFPGTVYGATGDLTLELA